MKKFIKHPAVAIVGLLLAYLALNGLTTYWDDKGEHAPRLKRPTYTLTT